MNGYTNGYTWPENREGATMRGKGEGSVAKDTATGLWVARIELPGHDGERRRRVKRSKDKAVAVRWLTEQQAELGRRGDLSTASPTLEWWTAYWLDKIAAPRVRPNTLAGHRAALGHLSTIGKVRLDKLGAAQLRRAYDGMRAKGLSETTILLTHRVLARSLKDARREGRVGALATDMLDAPRKAVADVQALTVDEAIDVVRRAVLALQAVPYDPFPVLDALALLTGARRGELLGLEADRVGEVLDLSWQLQRIGAKVPVPADYERREVAGTLWLTRPKSRAGWRIIPLIPTAKALLADHLARNGTNAYGLVFTVDGKPIDPQTATNRWRAVSPNPAVTFHGLRHTTVDLLYAAGVSEDVIVELVGHSQRATTRGYKSAGKIARRTEAMASLGALLQLSAPGGDEDGEHS